LVGTTAPRELPLQIVDSLGYTVYSTTIMAGSAPTVTSVFPSSLSFHLGNALKAQRVELKTPDAKFFAAFKTKASLLGREFPVEANETDAYFDFTPFGF
jgi:hypothetical protein